ncbi:MAG TPA: TetR/AcrR family transcriptional regulator [Nocardioidaceae bacterium]|nr:TetR/AcrR family transcriptional regulator [Nocardioidaceae bacterium]
MARIRLTPAARREQLLGLGAQLLSTRTLDELSIDLLAEEAGISRGLLYHYFANKLEFHRAIVGRVIRDLVAATAPVDLDDPLERLRASMEAYVDFVSANEAGYRSVIQAAHGGDPELKAAYDEGRAALLNRMFESPVPVGPSETTMERLGFADTPAARLVVHGWASMAESMVLDWLSEPNGVTREQMLDVLIAALPGALLAASNL